MAQPSFWYPPKSDDVDNHGFAMQGISVAPQIVEPAPHYQMSWATPAPANPRADDKGCHKIVAIVVISTAMIIILAIATSSLGIGIMNSQQIGIIKNSQRNFFSECRKDTAACTVTSARGTGYRYLCNTESLPINITVSFVLIASICY